MPTYCNKITYYGRDLIDLTADTVTPDKLFKGVVAHSASGSTITGTAEVTVSSTQSETGIIIPVGLYTVGTDS